MGKFCFKECQLGDKFVTRCGDIAILVNPLWSEFAVSIAHNGAHTFTVDSDGCNEPNHELDIIRKFEEMKKCPVSDENIFKDAKFGDKFLTKDGHEAILFDKAYIKHMGEFEYDLMVFIGEFDADNWEIQQVCVNESGMIDDTEYELNIVSRL